MQKVNNLVNQLGKQDQSGQTRQQENTSKRTVFSTAWRKLEAMKYVHDPIGSTDFKYWEASVLADFSEQDIQRGAKRAEDWKGFMGLGDFRGLCRKERNHPSHSQFKALPHKAMEGNEIQLRLRKMRKELGL